MAAKNFKLATKNEGEYNVQMFVGETIIAKADVKRFNSMSTQDYGVVGELFVTNFKIAFAYSTDIEKMNSKKHDSVVSLDKILSQEHCHLNDLIPLTAIYKIHAISTVKQKRKKVKNAKKEISQHYDIIEIETKDFRVIQYDFTDSQVSDRRSCFQMISHYAYPTSVTRLFGFDYGVNMGKSNTENGRAFCMFSHNKDYEMNLSRLQSSAQWRVSNVNSKFRICHSLPEYNVCPATLEDEELIGIANYYLEKRFPIWLWNDPKTGVALLISSRLREVSDHPKNLLDCISMCHHDAEDGSHGSQVTKTFDICSLCPNLKELKVSFDQLRKASVVHSSKEFWTTDSTWLSDIENSRWLQYVSKCLSASEKIARIMKDDLHSVIVNDDNGRDFSILTTSLVQILLDPYYRTHVGLQALIQKDWVMGGHPFSRRLRNIYDPSRKLDDKSDVYDGESPVFVLFVDCVHQLLHQYPMKFEYTEQFLILIADCCHSSLFQTFMFDCDYEYQSLRGNSHLVSAWDFISVNMPLSKFSLRNPAYNIDKTQPRYHTSLLSTDADSGETVGIEFIMPFCKLVDIKLWCSYFCRWFPSTSICKGFTTNVILQLQQKRLMEEVTYLEDRMVQLQHMSGLPDNEALQNNSSSLGRRKYHKRENSKHDNNEEDYEGFFSLMSDFYFLKLL